MDTVDERSPMSKDDIAEGFATIAAPVLADRGKVPIRAGKGKARLIYTVAPSGEVTGVVPHGAVVQGLLVRQGVEGAVVEGKRPACVSCEQCKRPIPTKKVGRPPSLCASCKDDRRKRRRSRVAKAKWRSNIDESRAQRRAEAKVARVIHRDTYEAYREKTAERRRELDREAAKRRRAKRAAEPAS